MKIKYSTRVALSTLFISSFLSGTLGFVVDVFSGWDHFTKAPHPHDYHPRIAALTSRLKDKDTMSFKVKKIWSYRGSGSTSPIQLGQTISWHWDTFEDLTTEKS
jgi:hypothetical protein